MSRSSLRIGMLRDVHCRLSRSLSGPQSGFLKVGATVNANFPSLIRWVALARFAHVGQARARVPTLHCGQAPTDHPPFPCLPVAPEKWAPQVLAGYIMTIFPSDIDSKPFREWFWIGDKFGESLGGGQAPPSFWEVPQASPEVPQASKEVFLRLPRKFSPCGT